MERDDVRQRTINFVRSLTELSEHKVKEKFGAQIEALAVAVGEPLPGSGRRARRPPGDNATTRRPKA